jgi:hypothetical protein
MHLARLACVVRALTTKTRRAIAVRAQALDLEEATTAVKALHAVICTHGPSGPQGGIGGILPQT